MDTATKNKLAALLIEFCMDEIRPELNYLMDENKRTRGGRWADCERVLNVDDAIDTILDYMSE